MLPLALFLLAPAISIGQAQDDHQESRSYDSNALSHYLDGDMYMMQGDHGAAVRAYAQALRYDSTSATIYLSLGEAYLQLSQPHKAWQAGQKALALEPQDGEVHKFLSSVAIATSEFPKAVKHLEEWYRLDPTDMEPLFRKAALHLQQKKYAEAVDTYLGIYDRDPMQTQVLTRAGEIALSINDYERGYQVYGRLQKRRPDDLRILRTFAEVAVRAGHTDEAISAYQTLVAADNASLGSRVQLAWLLRQAGKLDESLSHLTKLIEEGHRQWEVLHLGIVAASDAADFTGLDRFSGMMIEIYPDSAEGYSARAIARSNLDDPLGAIEVLETAAQRIPANGNIDYLLGNLYYSVRRYEDAEARLKEALRIHPKVTEIRQLLAAAWSELRRFRASDSLYEKLIEEQPKDAIALNNYAYSIADRELASRKRLRYARKLSRRSLKLESDNPAFLDTYGWVLYKLGWVRRAGRYIARSIELRPGSPEVLEHMGAVHRRRGQNGEAERLVEEARQIRLKRQILVRAEEPADKN